PNGPVKFLSQSFALSATNPNLLFVVLSTDQQFCQHIKQNIIQQGSTQVQLQVENPARLTTYVVPLSAQFISATCSGTQDAQSGSVSISTLDGGNTSGSFNVNLSLTTSESGSFTATNCQSLQNGLPFSGAAATCQ